MTGLSKLLIGLVLSMPLSALALSGAAAGDFERAGVNGKAYHYRTANAADGAHHAHPGGRDHWYHRHSHYDRPDDRRVGHDRVDDRHGSWRDKQRVHRRLHRQYHGGPSGKHADHRKARKHHKALKAHRRAHERYYDHWRRKHRWDARHRDVYDHRYEKALKKHYKKHYKRHNKKLRRHLAKHAKHRCWNMRHKSHGNGRPAVIGSTACRDRHGRTYIVPGSGYVVRYLY